MKPPCIRGLKEFKKSCPEKCWDGSEGCPAWLEMPVVDLNDPTKKTIERKCLDIWMFHLAWCSNRVMEGNQQAVESLRNGMCEVDPKTKQVRPKMDRGSMALLTVISNQQRLIK